MEQLDSKAKRFVAYVTRRRGDSHRAVLCPPAFQTVAIVGV